MTEPLFADAKGREVASPHLGGLIADTHAHLDMLDDPGLALARAARAGVGFIATIADASEDASRTFEELPAWLASAASLLSEAGLADTPLPRVRVVVGVHPHNAKDFNAQVEVELQRLASHALTSAIGEIGLDYHYDHSPREVQRQVFRRQLEIARELDLAAVVHLREAHDEGQAIMREVGVPDAGCVLHCYNLGPELLGEFLEIGCTVSFAGPVTFKKADEVRAAAAIVPLERILTETDCPFMAPEPFRGRKNEPALVAFTAARIADCREQTPESFARASFANAVQLFDRPRP